MQMIYVSTLYYKLTPFFFLPSLLLSVTQPVGEVTWSPFAKSIAKLWVLLTELMWLCSAAIRVDTSACILWLIPSHSWSNLSLRDWACVCGRVTERGEFPKGEERKEREREKINHPSVPSIVAEFSKCIPHKHTCKQGKQNEAHSALHIVQDTTQSHIPLSCQLQTSPLGRADPP